MHRTTTWILAAVLLASLALVGCGGSGGGGPPPTLTSVTTNEGPTYGGTILMLTGSGFAAAPPTVRIGGLPADTVTVTDDTSLTCRTPAHARGIVDVSVTTPGGTATLPGAFTYRDLMSGAHEFAMFLGDLGASGASLDWGRVDYDGIGSIAGPGVERNNTVTVTGAPIGPHPYAVSATQRLTWSNGIADTYEGGVNFDGTVACLGTVLDGAAPAIGIQILRRGVFLTSTLTGAYHVCTLFHNGGFEGAIWGEVVFDGAGSSTSTVFNNADGTPGGPFVETTGYTVAANGQITWTFSGQTHEGRLLQGANLAVLGGGNVNTTAATLIVMIKKSTLANDATLIGPYHYIHMTGNANPGATYWTSATGLATADGAGTVTNDLGIDSIDGVRTVVPAGGTLTYIVSADGSLLIGGGVDPGQGGVSPDGRFAVWAGGPGVGDDPQLWFLMR